MTLLLLPYIVVCILSIRSEDQHTFSSLTMVRGRKPKDDSISINKLNYFTNILKTRDNPLSISETLETSVRLAPRLITNDEDNPFMYMQLWKGTYPDMLNKRARSGFVGMRGKKDNGFVEFGKKQPELFGMRGKKYPYEFRGRFVGVRGKKVFHELPHYHTNFDLKTFGQELHPNQLMLVLTEQNEPDGV